jgi:hypothetical protein
MSKWRISIDCGKYSVSEIGDRWGGGESFATEAAAVDELRRIQHRAVQIAESDLKIVKQRLVEKREQLAAPPRIRRMQSAQAPSPAVGDISKGDE